MFKIGPYQVKGKVLLAPMAGITDLPFRILCRKFGADYAVGEMAATQEGLQKTEKTRLRYTFDGEPEPRAIQLIGADPKAVADSAKRAVDCGAQIIDLNCGCPVKKVCSVACGSALLKDPLLIGRLLKALVSAVDVPVTLKYRTGWDASHINAMEVAHIAEQEGVSLLVLHGRTRDQGYKGQAEYQTIQIVKKIAKIPVIANGDITSFSKAEAVLSYTHADGVMIGRAAFGNPWIFQEIQAGLNGEKFKAPGLEEIYQTILEHQTAHIRFYGEHKGVRTFRKHLNWYLKRLNASSEELLVLNQMEDVGDQRAELEKFFVSRRRERLTQSL